MCLELILNSGSLGVISEIFSFIIYSLLAKFKKFGDVELSKFSNCFGTFFEQTLVNFKCCIDCRLGVRSLGVNKFIKSLFDTIMLYNCIYKLLFAVLERIDIKVSVKHIFLLVCMSMCLLYDV